MKERVAAYAEAGVQHVMVHPRTARSTTGITSSKASAASPSVSSSSPRRTGGRSDHQWISRRSKLCRVASGLSSITGQTFAALPPLGQRE